MQSISPIYIISFLVLAGLLLSTPVYAETGTAPGMTKPTITVSLIPSSPVVGDSVIISGTAKGGNLTPGVSMWIFAGNYVNITTVPVNESGFYSRKINTADLPPAYYYIFVQHPGSDTRFNIDVKGFSGQVINTNTGDIVFNFTGTGSVNDNAAAIALSTAFNSAGVDDVFSKTGVELLPSNTTLKTTTPVINDIQVTMTVANGSRTNEIPPVSTMAAAASPSNPDKTMNTGPVVTPSVTKAPLSTIMLILGIGIAATGLISRRKN